MLKQRIITGVIMALLFVGTLLLPEPYRLSIFSVVVVIAAWEWANLAGYQGKQKLGFAALVGLLLLVMGLSVDFTDAGKEWLSQSLGSATTLWGVLLLWVITYPASATVWGSQWARALLGVIVLSAAWLAVAYLCYSEQSALLILYIIAVAAFADIGAYFAGVGFGKHKFAPAVSPKKTWEGFAGGMVASGVLAYCVAEFYGLLALPVLHAVVLSVVCAAASAVGDLAVSMLKRNADVKDSSNLLPGHGGFLDRIDGMLAALPLFVFGLLMAGA